MSRRTLLLNDDYQPLAFISERKLWKFMYKDKIEIISNWNKDINWMGKLIGHPCVVKMKKHIYYYSRKNHFSRKVLILRDNSTCQYCGKKLSANQITIDHITPKHRGGRTNYTNCVVSCYNCNNKKGNKLLEETSFKLIKAPTVPSSSSTFASLEFKDNWHDDWNNYLHLI